MSGNPSNTPSRQPAPKGLLDPGIAAALDRKRAECKSGMARGIGEKYTPYSTQDITGDNVPPTRTFKLLCNALHHSKDEKMPNLCLFDFYDPKKVKRFFEVHPINMSSIFGLDSKESEDAKDSKEKKVFSSVPIDPQNQQADILLQKYVDGVIINQIDFTEPFMEAHIVLELVGDTASLDKIKEYVDKAAFKGSNDKLIFFYVVPTLSGKSKVKLFKQLFDLKNFICNSFVFERQKERVFTSAPRRKHAPVTLPASESKSESKGGSAPAKHAPPAAEEEKSGQPTAPETRKRDQNFISSIGESLQASFRHFIKGLKHTFQFHWLGMLISTALLGLFTFPKSLLPQGIASLLSSLTSPITGFLLSNLSMVILISVITFSVGYVLLLLTRMSKDESRPDNEQSKRYLYLKKASYVLMRTSVIGLLLVATMMPMPYLFLQNVVIGNGISTGFVTHLWLILNKIGLEWVAAGLFIAYGIGVIITKIAARNVVDIKPESPLDSYSVIKGDIVSSLKNLIFYGVAQLGVALIYASIFAGLLLITTQLSIAWLSSWLGYQAALSVGVAAVVGPSLFRILSVLGSIAEGVTFFAKLAAIGLKQLKYQLIMGVCYIRARLNAKFNPSVLNPYQVIAGVEGEKEIRQIKIKEYQRDLAEKIFTQSVFSSGWTLLFGLYNLPHWALSCAFYLISFVCSELTKVSEILAGKLPPSCDLSGNVRVYYQTSKNYEPILSRDRNGHESPLFCHETQKELAMMKVISQHELNQLREQELRVGFATTQAIGSH